MHAFKSYVSAGLTACGARLPDSPRAAALSAPYRLNAFSPGDQWLRQNVAGANDDRIVLWQDLTLGSTFMRRFDAGGSPIGGEVSVGAGVTHVAIDAHGNFALLREAGDRRALYLRQYRRDGSARTPEILVNSATGYGVQGMNLTYTDDGELVVYWTMAATPTQTGWKLYTKAFDAAGQALAWEAVLDTTPSCAVIADGRGTLLTAWSEIDPRDGREDIYIGRRDKYGYLLSERIRITGFAGGNQTGPKLALARDGSFVLAWNGYDRDGSCDVYGQRFSADLARLGMAFRVNSSTWGDRQEAVDVAMTGDGRFVFAWHTSERRDGPEARTAIHLREYRADGTPCGPGRQVNAPRAARPGSPLLSLTRNGLFSVAWREYDLASGNYDVMQRWYALA